MLSRKGQAVEWMIWITRIVYVLFVVLALSVARSSLINVRTDISTLELGIVTNTLVSQLPPDLRLTTQDLHDFSTTLANLSFTPEKKIGARMTFNNKILYWREQDYQDLSVLEGAGVFKKKVHAYTQHFPMSVNNKPGTLTVEVLERA